MAEQNDSRPEDSPGDRSADEFASQADQESVSLLRELVDFVRFYKKWYLIPMLVVLGLVGLLVLLSGTAAAPFIYPLF